MVVGQKDLTMHVVLGAELLILGGKANDIAEGPAKINAAIANGSAVEAMAEDGERTAWLCEARV